MPFITCTGHRIRYETWGRPTSFPPLILIHGWQNNVTGWYQQIPYFSRLTEVLAYDQLGNGKSAKARNGIYRLDLMEAVLYQFIRKLNLTKPILVGHSFGGMLAQYFALKHPEIPLKLVLLCTGPGVLSLPVKDPELKLLPLVKILGTFFKPFNYLFQNFVQRSDHTLTKKQSWNNFRRAITTDPLGSFGLLSAAVANSFRDQISAINLPMLFITGTHDMYKNQARFYRQHGAHVHIIRGGGHNLHQQFYEQVNSLIEDFIRR